MRIFVKVTPNARKDEVIPLEDNDFAVKVTDSPEKNRANLKVLKLLKMHFKKQVFMVRGGTSREKVFEVFE